jgi:alpha-tubulin suppressor-like RCC1 family protein
VKKFHIKFAGKNTNMNIPIKYSLCSRVMNLLVISSSMLGAEVLAPNLSPADGDSLAVFPLTITNNTPGAEIHYTLNGFTPTKFDPVIASGDAISIGRNVTVKAKSWIGTETSATATGSYALLGDISAGGAHSLAMKSPGEVWAWGLQTNGRLGNDSSLAANITSPIASRYALEMIGDARMVAAGLNHSVFLKSGGTVWCYGQNSTGQLGDNSITNRLSAVQVIKGTVLTDYLTDCIAVAAGDGFSLALSEAGEVYAWGSKTSGRLGDGLTSGSRRYAGKVFQGVSGSIPLAGMSRIAAYGGSSLAISSGTGNVWAWGANSSGQLGLGSTTSKSRALQVKLNSTTYISDAWDVSCGESHAAIVRWNVTNAAMQGRVFCSGQQQYGRLGNNLTASASKTYPVEVVKTGGVPLEGIVSVAAGSSHTLGLDNNGNVWAWGYNGNGALGDNSVTSRGYAAKVTNPSGTGDLSNIVRIAAGGTGLNNHSMAIASDGTVYTWGYNANGQLANGIASTTPVQLPIAVITGFDVTLNPPDVTIVASVTQTLSPGVVSLTATVNDADGVGNIQKVQFFDQGLLVATLNAPPWSVSVSNRAGGNHHVYAIVTDMQNQIGMSPPVEYLIQTDADQDGLVDSWEITWFGSIENQAAGGDADGDKVSNRDEMLMGSNPMSALDADNDTLPDDWERHHFGNTADYSAISDPDSDRVRNGAEWGKNTDPLSNLDTDTDGLPDDWEIFWFGNITSQTGDSGYDADRVSNRIEWFYDKDPTRVTDDDADGVPDEWEYQWFGYLNHSGLSDADGDKITHLHEWMMGTNPSVLIDSDKDGLPDDWERFWFGDLTSNHGSGDADSDAVTNLVEFQQGSNPASPLIDSDADGVPDIYEDSDDDGLSDSWEQLLIDSGDGSGNITQLLLHPWDDFDGDGVSNLVESQLGLCAYQVDSDADGYGDRLSVDQRLHLRLDDGSGIIAADSSFLQNLPTQVQGGVSWVPAGGVERGALQFDGGSGVVMAPASTIHAKSDLTISIWFKTSTLRASQTLLNAAKSSAMSEIAISLENNSIIRFHSGGGVSRTWTYGRNLVDGLWHHLAITRDSMAGQVSLYVDGLACGVPQNAPGGSLVVDSLAIGQRHLSLTTFNPVNAFVGMLDEVRIYSEVLDPHDIQELSSPGDLDKDGIPDGFEFAMFQNLITLEGGVSDLDGDGQTDYQEYASLTDPRDYYNGQLPVITLVSGADQIIHKGQQTLDPLVFRVTVGANPRVNAPVNLNHLAPIIGGLKIASGAAPDPSLTLRTDSEGKVAVYFKAN